jgi:hypothetical protein
VTELAALQAALAAEQATIYGYGVSGSILRGSDRDYATDALEAHMVVRDRLIALVTAMGATPVAARAAYRLPFAVTGQTTAGALAGHVERGCADAFWDLVAATGPGSAVRTLAIGWLGDAAIRAAHWGAQQALPGQPTPT